VSIFSAATEATKATDSPDLTAHVVASAYYSSCGTPAVSRASCRKSRVRRWRVRFASSLSSSASSWRPPSAR